MMLPKKKWQKTPEYLAVSEDALQEQANDLLAAYGIEYIRIPDGIWRWLQCNAPSHVQAFFKSTFRGMADNVCMIPISDKYSLCLNLELKSAKGKLHGKQKEKNAALSWQVSRSVDDTVRIVAEFKRDADRFRKLFDRISKLAGENDN